MFPLIHIILCWFDNSNIIYLFWIGNKSIPGGHMIGSISFFCNPKPFGEKNGIIKDKLNGVKGARMKRGVLIAVLIVIIFFIILFLIGGFVYLQFSQEPYISENSYLKINLIGQIVDTQDVSFSSTLTIRDLWYHINRAKIDPRIKGIILRISNLSTGFAKIEDIGRLIADFKKSGKKVYAFIVFGGVKEYYLATFADKIYAFKDGDMFLNGLAAEAIFLKETLTKLGINAEFYHIGEYKTAYNMFTENKVTQPHRESLQKLLDDIYQSILIGISKNRKIAFDAVKKTIEDSPISFEAYYKAKFIDGIIYEDEILAESKIKYKMVDFLTYKQTSSPIPFKGSQKIAVIFASGEIHSGNSGKQSLTNTQILGSNTVIKQLKTVRLNPAVKSVVLRVDSPGGSSIASSAILREAYLLSQKKPLVVSMSDLAASGGYMISVRGAKIYALPQTITGSIGVLGGKFILKKLYDKIGLKKEVLKTSEYADMYSDYKKFTPRERQKFIQVMNKIYKSFVTMVSEGRNLKFEDVEKVSKGRVWAGNTAKKIKLVDHLGGLGEAIAEAKKLAKIQDSESFGVIVYPKMKSFLTLIYETINKNGLNAMPAKVENLVSRYKNFFPAVRLPYTVTIR